MPSSLGLKAENNKRKAAAATEEAPAGEQGDDDDTRPGYRSAAKRAKKHQQQEGSSCSSHLPSSKEDDINDLPSIAQLYHQECFGGTITAERRGSNTSDVVFTRIIWPTVCRFAATAAAVAKNERRQEERDDKNEKAKATTAPRGAKEEEDDVESQACFLTAIWIVREEEEGDNGDDNDHRRYEEGGSGRGGDGSSSTSASATLALVLRTENRRAWYHCVRVLVRGLIARKKREHDELLRRQHYSHWTTVMRCLLLAATTVTTNVRREDHKNDDDDDDKSCKGGFFSWNSWQRDWLFLSDDDIWYRVPSRRGELEFKKRQRQQLATANMPNEGSKRSRRRDWRTIQQEKRSNNEKDDENNDSGGAPLVVRVVQKLLHLLTRTREDYNYDDENDDDEDDARGVVLPTARGGEDDLKFVHVALRFLIDVLYLASEDAAACRSNLLLYMDTVHFGVHARRALLRRAVNAADDNNNDSTSSNQDWVVLARLLWGRLSRIMSYNLPAKATTGATTTTAAAAVAVRHARATALQKLCLRHYPNQTRDLVFAGVGLLCGGRRRRGRILPGMLTGLSTKQVRDVLYRMRLVEDKEENAGASSEGNSDNDNDEHRSLLLEILEDYLSLPEDNDDPLATESGSPSSSSSFLIYPTEQILWDPYSIPPSRRLARRGRRHWSRTTSQQPEQDDDEPGEQHRAMTTGGGSCGGPVVVLNIPKLETRFLSPADYLQRNYELIRLSTAYEIRSDLVRAVNRLRPVLRQSVTDEDVYGDPDRMAVMMTTTSKTEFTGWARMALELVEGGIDIVQVTHPALQLHRDKVPLSVSAEFTVDLAESGRAIREQWDSLRDHDVLFVMTIDAAVAAAAAAAITDSNDDSSQQEQDEGLPDEEDWTFARRNGITAVRGCTVMHIRDEEGNNIATQQQQQQLFNKDSGATGRASSNTGKATANNAPSGPVGTKRTFRVALDPTQYALDRRAHGKNVNFYQGFNVVVRRHGRENNFKAVLETIRSLIDMSSSSHSATTTSSPLSTTTANDADTQNGRTTTKAKNAASDGGGTMSTMLSLPAWLSPIILGEATTDAASTWYESPTMREYAKRTVGVPSPDAPLDYGDTFLDERHLRESFPEAREVNIVLHNKDDKNDDGGKEQEPHHRRWNYRVRRVVVPQRQQRERCEDAAGTTGKREQDGDETSNDKGASDAGAASPGTQQGNNDDDDNDKNEEEKKIAANSCVTMEATPYPFAAGHGGDNAETATATTTTAAPVGNPIRFTPTQVKAITAGLSTGLTCIVGPPGTGKTDVAVQLIANLFHCYPTQRTVIVTHSNAALNDIFTKVLARNDIPERTMVRLGLGERDLQIGTEQQQQDQRQEDDTTTSSSFDFTKGGRVAYSLARRGVILERVQALADALQTGAQRGTKGESAFTCETAEYFYRHTVQKHIRSFEALARDKNDSEDVRSLYPFAALVKQRQQQPLQDQQQQSDKTALPLSAARDHARRIKELFSELAEYRPLELLRSHGQQCDYMITKQARIVAMTCTHAAIARSHLLEQGFEYDNLVVEEAGQMTEIETFVPLLLQRQPSRLKRVCFMGDPYQLPPVIQNQTLAAYSNLDQSMFVRLIQKLGVPYVQLDKQGRARPQICDLYRWRYTNNDNNNNDKTLGDLPAVQVQPQQEGGSSTKLSRYQLANPGFVHTFQLVHVDDFEGKGETTPTAFFYQNAGEAEYAVALFQYMVLIGYSPGTISILTTYNGQKELIMDVLRARCGPGTPLAGVRPKTVSTVDQYQGQQNDYILLSLVRTVHVGHVRDVRRLVVALSRARLGLYILCRTTLFERLGEWKPVWDILSSRRPKRLQLVVGESVPTTRTDSADAVVPEERIITIDDVTHLGTMVYEMQREWIQQQQQQQQQQEQEQQQQQQREQQTTTSAPE